MNSDKQRVRNIFDGQVLIAQIYDLNCDGEVIFPTQDDAEMQCGFGLVSAQKTIQGHIHHRLHRQINHTSEFIFVMKGSMDVVFYNDDKQKLSDATLLGGMGMLQFIGGHAIEIGADTKYIEVKQGPYFGSSKEKTLLKT